ncbi:hypothetical protein O181_025944 [Austropuccinia psidii MF-1]|uniref:Uncharacterized protein n=1 Tax=Austropuccinia psidii MF-1 TaxID=1389203 RepID=A0A9Q3CLJ3_9BASI|nr:hypothetical protein [Austropuccinia psidii MF-1]
MEPRTDSAQLAQFPPVLICPSPPRPPSNCNFTLPPDQSDYLANEGWQWQEDILAWADCHHFLSPMGFKRKKQNPSNPPQQYSPGSHIPHGKSLQESTPGPSVTQWLEDLFCGKQKAIPFRILNF